MSLSIVINNSYQ